MLFCWKGDVEIEGLVTEVRGGSICMYFVLFTCVLTTHTCAPTILPSRKYHAGVVCAYVYVNAEMRKLVLVRKCPSTTFAADSLALICGLRQPVRGGPARDQS